MRRTVAFLVAGVGLVVGGFLYYVSSVGGGDYSDFGGYVDWLLSWFWRLVLKGQSVTGNYFDKAVSLIADFEGFSPKVYNDAGHMAIGYGHDIVPGDGFDASSTISEADARALLIEELQDKFDPCITNNVTADLNDNQHAALLSLVYNIGCGNFQGSSVLRALNQGDYETAGNDFALWNKSHVNGVLQVNQTLVDRRASEMDTFFA